MVLHNPARRFPRRVRIGLDIALRVEKTDDQNAPPLKGGSNG
jgi:hypothetical protein